MILGSVEDGDKNTYDTFGICAVAGSRFVAGDKSAASKERPGQVADGGYDYR